ncbi:MAG TPA: hypothetical protein VGJ86_02510 [Acidimicrobiales bacterium]
MTAPAVELAPETRGGPRVSGAGSIVATEDRVAIADDLRTSVALEIAGVAATPPSDIYVGWVAALEAAGCPARYRAAGGDGGWGFPGWSPNLAGASVGRAALARHVELAGDGPLHPLEAVRGWVRDMARSPTSPVGSWVADLARAGDRAELAATAASATRWIGGFARMTGWPLPERLALVTDEGGPFGRRWPKRWRPGRGAEVCVASSPDAVVGRVSAAGHFDLLVHRPMSPSDEAVADRAAFEAAAGTLSCGIAFDEVVVATADTGERQRFRVDPNLLARGVELIVAVVRQRVLAQDDWDFTDATPSPACRHCPARADCPAGQTWLSGPGRWRGGLPTV